MKTTDLIPTRYEIKENINLDRCVQRDDSYLWGIFYYDGCCLSKTSGHFEFSPLNSNKTDKWIADHRWQDPNEALEFWDKVKDTVFNF